jgi:hypothetical protein
VIGRVSWHYTKRFCTHCGVCWSTELGHNHIRLGPPFMICHRCRYSFPSGLKEWPTMTPQEQRGYRLRWIPTIVFFWAFFFLVNARSCVADPDFGVPFFGVGSLICLVVVVGLLLHRANEVRNSCWRYFTFVANHHVAQVRANLAVKR